jgi:hypothetical protein
VATSRTTTSWSPGDMSHNVKALHMGPSRSSPRHGPPVLGRGQGPPVPRRHRSYAALRPPASFGHGSGSPCRWPTSWRTLLLCLVRPTTRAPANVPCVGDGSPALRKTGLSSRRGEGLPGYGAILFVRAVVEHPAGYHPLLAHRSQGIIVAFAYSSTLGIRED